MDLRDYLRTLRRRWVSITGITLAIPLLALAIMMTVTPKFTATTQLFFSVQGGESVSDLAQGSTFTEQQMASYARVAVSPLVLDPVIERLKLGMTSSSLSDEVVAEAFPNTVILQISVSDPAADRAAEVANAIGRQLTSVSGELVPRRGDGSPGVRATILAAAVVPDRPSSPNYLRNLTLALVCGLLLGIGVAMMRHFLDTKIRSVADVQALTDVSVLGVIPVARELPSNILAQPSTSSGHVAAVRRLRVNLQLVGTSQRSRCIVVTSSVREEGKTLTAAALALAIAHAGQRVLLIDANLGDPALSRLATFSDQPGLSNLLRRDVGQSEVLHNLQSQTLHIMTAGTATSDSGHLLGSAEMVEVLNNLARSYDVVVLDTPSVLVAPDALILSKIATDTLLVVGVDLLQRPQLRESLESFETIGSRVTGLVLNKVPLSDSRSYGRLNATPDWTLPESSMKEEGRSRS